MNHNVDDGIITLLFERDEFALEKIQEKYGQLIKQIAFNGAYVFILYPSLPHQGVP